jgi:hypothetical protein
MPTSRPEKFTVIQNGLAQSRIFFPTENEPIFRYRRPGLKPERRADFVRIQTEAHSQYAIQKTGVNSGSGHADDRRAPAAIPFLRSPDPLQKIKKRSHFSPAAATLECEPPLAKIHRKANLQGSRQDSLRTNAAAKGKGAGDSEQPGRAGLF